MVKSDSGKAEDLKRPILLIALGLVGWAICGATILVGRQLVSMDTTLVVHAIVAPLVFGLLTSQYFRRFPVSSPAAIAFALLGVVIGMDLFVVAPLFERSYDMFQSIIGTWIPFASIAAASYLVGRAMRNRATTFSRGTRIGNV